MHGRRDAYRYSLQLRVALGDFLSEALGNGAWAMQTRIKAERRTKIKAPG